jgi:hypothetical protein
MPFPNSSAHTTMSCCRWTHPFGAPVLPDEYSQNAGASRLVASAAIAGDPFASSASSCGPATITWRSEGTSARSIASSFGSSSSLTIATRARESFSTCR